MPRRRLNLKDSSHIKAAYHDADKKILTVKFEDASHDYYPVDSTTATNFEYAPSHGKFLHQEIIPKHLSRKTPKPR